MKISELICELQSIKANFGDINIKMKRRLEDGYVFEDVFVHTIKPMGAPEVFACIESQN